MRELTEIRSLLDRLEEVEADALETQDLDFKEWPAEPRQAIKLAVDIAICMANGGGGSVVLGVRDRVVGRAKAILGVPPETEIHQLKRDIYERTAPKLTPDIHELHVLEGTGRLLVMQVHGGLSPYTNTAGAGTVRKGNACVPLTGDLREKLMVERGDADFTAAIVPEPAQSLISAAAMERLRDQARQEQAPTDLLRKSDLDLLGAIGVLRDGQLTRAGLLIAGQAEAIGRHLPNFGWTHERMKSATAYDNRVDGRDENALALPLALAAIEARINADNPISTIEHGLYHFEYRAYPTIALREALLNALTHLDLRLASPVLVKQYPRRLEITNPGGLVGGITSANILHHPPLARNLQLVQALARLRLVNRSNLGIGRMFEAMLVEGKEPPLIIDEESAVRVVFKRQETARPFREFIAEEGKTGRTLDVDHLLVLRYLLSHPEIDTSTAAELCQRRDAEMRDILDEMVQIFDYLERGGAGRGSWWRMKPALHRRLEGLGHAERDQRIDWDVAKTRVLNMLKQRARRGEPGLTNAGIREVTAYDRQQVNRLIHELEAEGVRMQGHGRGSCYTYIGRTDNEQG
ncbi:ATP-binding protein [Candidatus Accumulibacter phosphatis]|uniref:ATP-dependent DNA helicase RecG-related protein n=1 Tax=Candidatus Accumulibacter phosphatis TaxID=327160 RepID=A0A5S4ERH9_9PROT|nr:ATP-binding protein [Candidatus Accumulibacter phosphatis]TMQ74961.1 ATP-dependent DNA helicase RecG-related protein [Candidatus Accumulibacter phosphatis]TMQ78096.1 GTP-binding protein HflX [Candidatus Accumulibacter phosphatis]